MRIPPSPCASCKKDCAEEYHCAKWAKWRDAYLPKVAKAALRAKVALRMYREGANDREIGEATGYSTCSICLWRKRNGLPSVGKSGRSKPTKGESATC